jgi:uncharacterized protein
MNIPASRINLEIVRAQPKRVLGNYFLFEREGEAALFDPIGLRTAYLTQGEVGILNRNDDSGPQYRDLIRSLEELGFAAADPKSFRSEVTKNLSLGSEAQTPLHLSGLRIVLTRKCNMACSYCFVDTNDGSTDMSLAELEEGLQYLFEQNAGRDTVWIQWFGGEPSIRFDLIQEGDKIIRRLKKKYSVGEIIRTMVTNGLNVTEPQLRYFKKNGYGIGVSLDGVPKVNSIARTMLNGSSADSKIVGNIKRYVDQGIRVGINYTPTLSNVSDLPNFIDYCGKELGVNFVYVNFPIPTKSSWQIDGAEFANALFEAKQRALINGSTLYSGIDRVIFSINSQQPNLFDHEESFGGVIGALLPKGKVSLSEINFASPELIVRLEDLRSNPKLLNRMIKTVAPSQSCDSCPAISVCGGPQMNDVILRGTVDPDPQFCAFCVEAVSNALWTAPELH